MPTIARLTRVDGCTRRWRFGLRTLLVAVLVVGLGLGWLVRQLRRESEQVALVAELNRAGIYTWAYRAELGGMDTPSFANLGKRMVREPSVPLDVLL